MSTALRQATHTGNQRPREPESWTFLTNHSHVLVCLDRHRSVRLRDVAEMVGITERAVQRIVLDLERAGVISRSREGRCNVYQINAKAHLRHPLEGHRTVADLLVLAGEPLARRSGGARPDASESARPEPAGDIGHRTTIPRARERREGAKAGLGRRIQKR